MKGRILDCNDQPSPLETRLGPSRRQSFQRGLVIVNRQNHLMQVVLTTHPPSGPAAA